jgi:ubiquitin-protein ligase
VLNYTNTKHQREAAQIVHSNPYRMKRLVTETATMATSLPPGVFVKVGESRPDITKALIVGPSDSPYGYRLFE